MVETIKNKINSLPYDLRAEVVLASFLEEANAENEFNYYINPLSQFERSYRKDIVKSEVIDFEYDARQFLKINLSRDGIYDTLPEGILHYRNYNDKSISADEMSKHYQERKKEEESARMFFLPFENEFFEHSLDRENREKRYLLNLNGEKPLDFLFEFWGLSKSLPLALSAKFIRLLPYIYEITSNIPLIESSLSYLLNEKVEIIRLDTDEEKNDSQKKSMEEQRLGIDFVIGNNYVDHTVKMEVRVGPLENSEFRSYTRNGEMNNFLNIFYEYVFPIEIDLITTILLPTEKEEFKLEEINESVLGINTRI